VKLPGAERAVIPEAKLRDYILNPDNPDGRAKAAFLTRLGYSREEWVRLELDLRQQHLLEDAAPGQASPYGVKYEILGRLKGPSGREAWVRTIWIVLSGQTQPRLVTLVPGEKP